MTFLLAALLALAPVAEARKPPPATLDEADARAAAGDWDGAAAIYASLVKRTPDNPLLWYRLGFALHSDGDFVAAADAYAHAAELGFSPPLTAYNRACSLARAGDVDGAFAQLEVAVGAGFDDPGLLSQDADLASLRGDPRLAALGERADRNARPCSFDKHYQQLDFWVGDWDLVDANGTRLGRDTVEVVERGCGLREVWAGALGQSGQSLSSFDAARGVWVQLWTASTGAVVVYEGGLDEGGALVMTGTRARPDGSATPARATWRPQPDGRVQLVMATSTDGGQTWGTTLEAWFVRRPDEGGSNGG